MVGAGRSASLCCALLLVTAACAARVKAPCLEGREGRTRSEILLNDWACANKCGGGRRPQRLSSAARDRGGARHCDLCCASSSAATGRGAACGKRRGNATTVQAGRGDNTVHIVIEVVAGKNVAARPVKPGGTAGQEQGSVPPAGQEQGSVPPAGQEQGSVPPAGQEQGSVPPAGQEQGSVPPAGQEQGSVPPAGQEQGSVPPAGQEQGSVPPAGQGQGSVPPAGQEQGSVPPAGQEQGRVKAAGEGESSVPGVGEEQSGVTEGAQLPGGGALNTNTQDSQAVGTGTDYYFEVEVKDK